MLNVHDAVGGEAFFVDLVERFYQRVATDLLLRPLYPDDLEPLEAAPGAVPPAVLGRPGHLQRGAGPPAAAGPAHARS